MSWDTCFECGAQGPALPGQGLPLEAHDKTCPYRYGFRWQCSCPGPYCDESCDGRLVPPQEGDHDDNDAGTGPCSICGVRAMNEKDWLIIVNENMHEAEARVVHVDDAFPLDGWERVWGAFESKEEALSALPDAKAYAQGRAYPPS